MVNGNKKSRTFRRVFVKTPGGKVVTHYRRRKPSYAVCPITGKRLLGVPRDTPANIAKLTRSQRKPSRPYGGCLSSEAMRKVLTEKFSDMKLDSDDVNNVMQLGRLCVKLAGRDAGNHCVIVEKVDNLTVLIDGGVRRRKCNINHLLPLRKVLNVKEKASHEDVVKEFEVLNLNVWNKKAKECSEKPKKSRVIKNKSSKKPSKEKSVKKEN